MSVWQFIWNVLWREVGLVTRAVQTVAVTVPFVIALAIGLAGGQWSKEVWPAWVWLGLTVLVMLASLFVAVFRKAYAQELALQPRIAVRDLDVWNDRGERYIRAKVENLSSAKLSGLKAYVVSMTKPEPGSLVAAGYALHPDDIKGNFADLPIQLFTQQRLRERLAGGDAFAKPFDLGKNPKWLEVFQRTHAMQHMVHVYDAGKRHDIIPLQPMDFECIIEGPGADASFRLRYINGEAGFKIQLYEGDGHMIAEKECADEQGQTSQP